MVTSTEKREVRAFLVRLAPELHRELRIAAAEEEVSLEGLVRTLIMEYLEERADKRELVGK
jgi:predicted HicB family RNase H-like nuclease